VGYGIKYTEDLFSYKEPPKIEDEPKDNEEMKEVKTFITKSRFSISPTSRLKSQNLQKKKKKSPKRKTAKLAHINGFLEQSYVKRFIFGKTMKTI